MFGSNSDLSNIESTDSRPSSRTANQRPQSARGPSYVATPKNERRQNGVELPKIDKPGKLEAGSSTIQEESRIPKIKKIVKDVKTENEKAEASEAELQRKKKESEDLKKAEEKKLKEEQKKKEILERIKLITYF